MEKYPFDWAHAMITPARHVASFFSSGKPTATFHIEFQ
jgi:hypothetical protein